MYLIKLAMNRYGCSQGLAERIEVAMYSIHDYFDDKTAAEITQAMDEAYETING